MLARSGGGDGNRGEYSCYILYSRPSEAHEAETYMNGGMIDNLVISVKSLRGPTTVEHPSTFRRGNNGGPKDGARPRAAASALARVRALSAVAGT